MDPGPTQRFLATFHFGPLYCFILHRWHHRNSCLGHSSAARLWQIGKPVEPVPWPTAASNLLATRLLQSRLSAARAFRSLAHGLLFGGFIVLFVGTVLIGVEHVLAIILGRQSNEPVFHKGSYFAVYEVVLDTAGLAMLIGCAMFAFRRLKRPRELAHNAGDWAILGLVAAIGMTGYVVEGLRIVAEQTPMAEVSYVGHSVSIFLILWSDSVGIRPFAHHRVVVARSSFTYIDCRFPVLPPVACARRNSAARIRD